MKSIAVNTFPGLRILFDGCFEGCARDCNVVGVAHDLPNVAVGPHLLDTKRIILKGHRFPLHN